MSCGAGNEVGTVISGAIIGEIADEVNRNYAEIKVRGYNSYDNKISKALLNTKVTNTEEFKCWLRQCNVRQVETNVKEIKEAFEDVQRIITH